ncbi:hypothetical protein TNCV_3183501 [Trichonephila clavipes]|uniref:Uncharacterized protein n=1 Tax=Trichonephila clavipes TaxID=2585209 RepID=A0A8X6VAW5_TRICX|nr:hypothetical protein TNCV_3183501 [Trichonephila clavipes]
MPIQRDKPSNFGEKTEDMPTQRDKRSHLGAGACCDKVLKKDVIQRWHIVCLEKRGTESTGVSIRSPFFR